MSPLPDPPPLTREREDCGVAPHSHMTGHADEARNLPPLPRKRGRAGEGALAKWLAESLPEMLTEASLRTPPRS